MDINIRNIRETDINKGYVDILKQLSVIDNIDNIDFNNFVNGLHNNHNILVIEDINKSIIIGTITFIIECKIIHNMGKVCHIEDLVIDKNYRGLGLGKLLVDKVKEIAILQNCYKIILNCNEKNIDFYKKLSFNVCNTQMAIYL